MTVRVLAFESQARTPRQNSLPPAPLSSALRITLHSHPVSSRCTISHPKAAATMARAFTPPPPPPGSPAYQEQYGGMVTLWNANVTPGSCGGSLHIGEVTFRGNTDGQAPLSFSKSREARVCIGSGSQGLLGHRPHWVEGHFP